MINGINVVYLQVNCALNNNMANCKLFSFLEVYVALKRAVFFVCLLKPGTNTF